MHIQGAPIQDVPRVQNYNSTVNISILNGSAAYDQDERLSEISVNGRSRRCPSCCARGCRHGNCRHCRGFQGGIPNRDSTSDADSDLDEGLSKKSDNGGSGRCPSCCARGCRHGKCRYCSGFGGGIGVISQETTDTGAGLNEKLSLKSGNGGSRRCPSCCARGCRHGNCRFCPRFGGGGGISNQDTTPDIGSDLDKKLSEKSDSGGSGSCPSCCARGCRHGNCRYCPGFEFGGSLRGGLMEENHVLDVE